MAVRHSTSRRGFRNTQENSMRNIALVLALLATTGPVAAQDYLGTHLDSVRDETLRRHQQDMVTDRPGERRSKAPPRTTPSRQVSQAERQAAFSRNKAEYRRRMLRDGPAAANRWLDEQAGAAPADARPRATTRTGKTSCKKVRWVNRATPGFGGGPMTRSRRSEERRGGTEGLGNCRSRWSRTP